MSNSAKFTVTLLGAPDSGKSTFLKALQGASCTPDSVEVTVRDFKNNIDLIFHFTTQADSLKESVCCMLLYDLTSKESYERIKSEKMELACDNMKQDLSFLYMIGTKSDLVSDREVDYEEVSDFAQQ